jgi:hypothetical protein
MILFTENYFSKYQNYYQLELITAPLELIKLQPVLQKYLTFFERIQTPV